MKQHPHSWAHSQKCFLQEILRITESAWRDFGGRWDGPEPMSVWDSPLGSSCTLLGSAWPGQVGTSKGISQDPALIKINKNKEQFPPAPQGFQTGKVWLLTSHQTCTFIFRLLFHLPHPPNCHCYTDPTWALLPKITISGHGWQRNDLFKLSAGLEMSLADAALDVAGFSCRVRCLCGGF